MAKTSISKAWDDTRAIVRSNSNLFVAIGLALFVLPGTVAAVVNPSMLLGVPPSETGHALVWLLVLIIGLIGRLAATRLTLGAASVGQAIREGASRSPSVIGAILLFTLPFVLLLMPIMPRILEARESPDAGASLAFLAIVIAALFLGVRLILLVIPIAAADRGNPFLLLKRSWLLSSGNWWRLVGFVLLYFIASAIVTQVVQMLAGTVIRLLGGTIEPLSLGALLLGAVISAVGAVFAVIFTVMVARIYMQLAGAAAVETSVANSRTDG